MANTAPAPQNALQRFMRHEAFSAGLLLLAALLAIVFSNSPLSSLYDRFLDTPLIIQLGSVGLKKPLLLWINDGLMAIFFLLVGLELKREFMEGQLASRDQVLLPALAAAGGIAVPALVYLAIAGVDATLAKGWAIPTATDIAFALGVFSLLGRRVPSSLKIFLLTLAILDDLGAIIIIAAFYTDTLTFTPMVAASAAILVLILFNRLRIARLAPYIIVGVILWVSVLKSGIHATLAGVVLALTIPMRNPDGTSMLKRLEHALHPYVAYFVMPLFAFANAGVPLSGFSMQALLDPLPLAILLGLFLGKQIGVFSMVFLAVKTGLARRPEAAGWLHIYGVAVLTGIGFTMSLFIGMLSFAEPEHAAGVRFGVIIGSLLSGVVGYLVLRLAPATESGQGCQT
ncbi:Na+/H+ antiporter NhaA [Thermopetrobacter sp. TC1]|uniref:Na+/H+ antiporter NhaA n=1 Tax=Thermopetrobacter sp. TC1 TaxID=1495045 RepID=UPI000AFD5812|nr:Na+/H+ antiporter NhaA [Thermopetrobacter sp. TC1]